MSGHSHPPSTRHRQADGLKIGDEAPDFTLPTHNEGELNLQWYRSRKPVVIAFYPMDWTPACATHIPGYQVIIDKFEEYKVQLLCISVDSIPCHIAWAKTFGGFSFPLMSDYYPHGKVSQKYGVLNPKGFSDRVIFLIDTNGIIRFIDWVDPAGLPDNIELFRHIMDLPQSD
ncbi:MAG: redoxin domain-containing protein [Candidatus Zixiibacteriota bacterium]